MFTYYELLTLQSAVEERVETSIRSLKQSTHIDEIAGLRKTLEENVANDKKLLQKIKNLIKNY